MAVPDLGGHRLCRVERTVEHLDKRMPTTSDIKLVAAIASCEGVRVEVQKLVVPRKPLSSNRQRITGRESVANLHPADDRVQGPLVALTCPHESQREGDAGWN